MYGHDAMRKVNEHVATRAGRFADHADDERRRQHVQAALGIAPQARARGGPLGFGSSSQPFGVPSFGQMFGSTKKAAGRLFADGGEVDLGPTGAPTDAKPRRSVEDGVAELERGLNAARERIRTNGVLADLGVFDPIQRAMSIAMGR